MQPVPQSLQAAPEARPHSVSTSGLLVVSARPGLGQSVQKRLDLIEPLAYHVRQVETREGLEQALWMGKTRTGGWAASLIDLACPALPHLPYHDSSALARLTRPIALLDAEVVPPQQCLTCSG